MLYIPVSYGGFGQGGRIPGDPLLHFPAVYPPQFYSTLLSSRETSHFHPSPAPSLPPGPRPHWQPCFFIFCFEPVARLIDSSSLPPDFSFYPSSSPASGSFSLCLQSGFQARPYHVLAHVLHRSLHQGGTIPTTLSNRLCQCTNIQANCKSN
jgi:hypothetical protein